MSPDAEINAFHEALISNLPDLVVFHCEGVITFVNPVSEEALGYKPEDLTGLKVMDFVHPEDLPKVQAAMERRRQGHFVPPYPIRVAVKAGGYKFFEVRASEIILKDRQVNLAVLTDISIKRRAEMALSAEKEQLELTLRSIADGVITCDLEARILLLNKAASGITGWSREEAFQEFLPHVLKISKGQVNPVLEALATGKPWESHESLALEKKSGDLVRIHLSVWPVTEKGGSKTGAVAVFRDVTEREALDRERLRAQKLDSVGLLAGGIAHDFNNYLTAILGNLSLIRMLPPGDPEASEFLVEAEKATYRARDLTQQLLTFARGGAPVKEQSSVQALVEDSARFCLRGSKSELQVQFDQDLWDINVDKGQMSQVIQNLIINADQAMPAGGKVWVKGVNRYQETPFLHLKAGPYVQVSIRDEGIGISPENLARIFDPYFSTKEKGSGLGLAVAYSIMQKHEGRIEVVSEVGKGTEFTLYLPAVVARTVSMPKLADIPERLIHGRGRILVMDDESMVRGVARSILKYLGFEAILASSGEEALEIYQKHRLEGVHIDAVVLDLTVPGGMGGAETASRLLALDPSAKLLVSSGYSEDPVMSNYQEYGFAGRIPKPYKPAEFSEILTRVLHSLPPA